MSARRSTVALFLLLVATVGAQAPSGWRPSVYTPCSGTPDALTLPQISCAGNGDIHVVFIGGPLDCQGVSYARSLWPSMGTVWELPQGFGTPETRTPTIFSSHDTVWVFYVQTLSPQYPVGLMLRISYDKGENWPVEDVCIDDAPSSR